MATDGLKLYCRRPFAPAATSEFDYPLTSHYDEPDALVVFDDVLIPWDRVFINRNIETLRRQFFDTGAHALGNWQAQIRFSTKLKFIASVARKVTQVNGTDKIPGVQEKLGELAAIVQSVESAVLAAEYTATTDDAGMRVPGKSALYGAMGLQSETYPRVISILRDLVGGGVLQLPSSIADMTSSVTRPDMERYVQSPRASPAKNASSCSSLPGTSSVPSSPAATSSTKCSMPALRSWSAVLTPTGTTAMTLWLRSWTPSWVRTASKAQSMGPATAWKEPSHGKA